MEKQTDKQGLSSAPSSTCEASDKIEVFEQHRSRLTGIAYRILGARTEAEDVVQDCSIKWLEAKTAEIDNPTAWLTTVVTRRAIDVLRSAQRARVDYVGHWLPEPAATQSTPEETVELASTLSTAFLLVLERLSPKERAAFLLREVFELPYGQIAEAINVTEGACRKLVSRAKQDVQAKDTRHTPPIKRQKELLFAFETAIRTGSPDQLAFMLAEDVELRADGGGKVAAIRKRIVGADVVAFIVKKLHLWWREYSFHVADINGGLGVVLMQGNVSIAAVTFSYDQSGQVSDIQIQRNPEKLQALEFSTLQ